MNRFFGLVIGLLFCGNLFSQNNIDLSGIWRFQLDPMGFGKTPGSELYLSKLTESIMLPGSMDEGGKGIPNPVSHVDRLSRKFEYCGQAWYQREVLIPETWANKDIILNLERCHWETAVYIDGSPVGTDERLSTPNRFVVTPFMNPGVHTITICVDNRLKYPMDNWSHGVTEYTQTNWNGIVGKMELQAKPLLHFDKIKVTSDIQHQSILVNYTFKGMEKQKQGELSVCIKDKSGREICRNTQSLSFADSKKEVNQTLPLGKKIDLWDEFTPSLYTLEAELKTREGTDTYTTRFGMRKVEQGKHHIRLNDRDIHLRGVLDCCVFPLTGYPSTLPSEWNRILSTVRDYGFNHVRFHSWCPPEAAFVAADELGLYLQVELPMWIKDVGKYPARRDFFEKELYAILDEYGNHPSFLLMCNGNENEGNFDVLEDLVKKGQAYDNRHLYSASTARTHVKSDQFYTSHVTTKGFITVYEGTPSTDWDRNENSAIDVPVIAHETGQRCMYPNFKEIDKYTGVLEPRNFKVYQDRLTANGMLHQAGEFFRSTGAHTVLQYKEVNESLMRTDKSGGFQLLGLSDFPGQGCAFVGILDAFWESKGLVTPEKYRESCAPIVLLARLPKRTFSNREQFSAQMELYHYGKDEIRKGRMNWMLVDESGRILSRGKLSHECIAVSQVFPIGKIDVPLTAVTKAGKYTLKAEIADTVRNEWDIWIYPEVKNDITREIPVVRDWETAKKELAQGKNVFFVPEERMGRKTSFVSHFWNPIMFNWDPMIVGTCIHHQHPAFKDFPTSYYADWQWWDILNYAGAVDLTDFSGLTPIIQSVDTYEYNRKLGIAFEGKVGKGKLFFLNMDISKEMEKRPAAKQLLISVINYLKSEDFNPESSFPVYQLDALFNIPDQKEQDKGVSSAVNLLFNQ